MLDTVTSKVCQRAKKPLGVGRIQRPAIRKTGDMEYRHHWSLILASWITLAHLSVSAAMSFSKSLGDIGIGTLPRSARCPLILRSARAAFISLLSLSTISPDVFLGAPMPCQVLASKPGTDSATVGTSGSARERVAVVTASARTLPALMVSIDSGRGLNITCTCPPNRSVSAG